MIHSIDLNLLGSYHKKMKLLLFDIDGTLIDTGGAGSRSLNISFEELFSIKEAFKDISMAGKTDIQIMKEGMIKHQISYQDSILTKIINTYIKNLSIQMNNNNKHLKPGIKNLLQILSQKNDFAIGLLTGNIEKGARIKLEPFGLNQYFPSGAFGSDHEDRNRLLPIAVERFTKIVKRNINFRDCIIIGDTPRDVYCAKPYGARCIAVSTGPYSYDSLIKSGADFVMKDLSDTITFLNKIKEF
jgi:phosphoglycolate phosphatase-like HAD superfamily hydrolase